MGLEPYEIASLFRDRNAILLSIKEGIIAIDKNGYVTMMNNSAKTILGYTDDARMKKIEDVLPNTKLYEVLQNGLSSSKDEEMTLRGRAVIVNRTPIIEDDEVVGAVALS